MLRHLSPLPSQSAMMVRCPRAVSAASRHDPMKPAPPVTRIMGEAYRPGT